MTQAMLQTDRINLVPLSDEHLEFEVELDSDPEVMRYLTGQARTREQVMAAHRLRLATAEPVWRRGLASEGSRELLRHAFEDLGLYRVFAQTMTVNAGSRATMAAVGLTHLRTFQDEVDDGVAGSELGGVEYAITRDEWRAAKLEPSTQPSSSHRPAARC